MPKLVLVRHGQSQWNLENRFTGWVDVDLTAEGEAQARQSGALLKAEGIEFDQAYTSVQTRAIRTACLALEAADQAWVPLTKDWHLNERHYGGLTGLNKAETAQKHGEVWKAELPLCGLEKPLWVYANVIYGLDAPIQGAGYYYGDYSSDQFVISSLPHLVSVAELQAADVKPTRPSSLLIESFEGDWQKQWFTYNPKEWGRSTHKVYTDEWKAPTGARLAFEVRADQPNKLAIALDKSAAEVDIKGGKEWQAASLTPSDFLNASKEPLKDWADIKELRFSAEESLSEKTSKREVGGKWQGAEPQFRNLRWVVGP
jgi:hypothetical protein